MTARRFRIGDRLIMADHNGVQFGRVIDRSGSEYRTVFPEDGDWDDAHWCDEEDSMRFVHVDDSAIAAAIATAGAHIGPTPGLSPESVEQMCHWVQNRGECQILWTHIDWHRGYEDGQTGGCPYFAVAEVMRGRADPRG